MPRVARRYSPPMLRSRSLQAVFEKKLLKMTEVEEVMGGEGEVRRTLFFHMYMVATIGPQHH